VPVPVLLALLGCEPEAPGPTVPQPDLTPPSAPEAPAPPATLGPYERTREAIRASTATLDAILEALTEEDVEGLANTLHALYLMGERPWVLQLLRALWNEDLDAYPELDWGRLSAPAARVALASTLARLEPARRESYLGYLRRALAEPDPFVRAQAAVGLGFAGEPADVPALAELALGGAAYDGEAAVKALGIHGSESARLALLALRDAPRLDRRRRAVVRQVLLEAYPEARRTARQ
jgi:HEAT repeat protein